MNRAVACLAVAIINVSAVAAANAAVTAVATAIAARSAAASPTSRRYRRSPTIANAKTFAFPAPASAAVSRPCAPTTAAGARCSTTGIS